jgi:DNA repair protein RecO (recombination protein O)
VVPAYVLHRRAWSESSLIVELFTQAHGRFGAVARGARRTSKRSRPPLQPLQPLLVEWGGRGELQTLKNWELTAAVPPLVGNRLISALYLNELLYRLTQRNDAHPELWGPYENTLAALADQGSIVDITLRKFEMCLLAAIGYALDLQSDAGSGQAIEPNLYYLYDPERGATRTATGAGYAGDSLLALAHDSLVTEQQRADARRLMRQIIDFRLEGRPLKSRLMFRRSP